MRILLAALLLFALPAMAAKPAIPSLTEDESSAVAKGDVVLRDDPNDPQAMYAFVEIAAERSKVWLALNDADLIESSSGTISQCDPYTDVTENGVRTIKLHYILNVAWSEVVYYIHRQHHTTEDYLEWTLDPDKTSDLVQADGYYVLTERDGKTLLVYWAKTNSGRRVPAWIKDMLTGRALKGWLDTVKTTSEGT
ncbi:MAG: hypothetical protein KC912_01260 [Proteobacteria bacterium]|nr:hypothetical protein [Pseudomonadota bacterium]